MVQLNFSGDNPATGAFNAERQRQNVQRGADTQDALRQLQIQELGRTRDTEIGIDKAIRDFIRAKDAGQQPQAAAPPGVLRQVTPRSGAAAGAGPGPQGAVPGAQVAPGAAQGAPAPTQPSLTAATPFGGLQRGLAEVPGGGAAALGLAQQDQTAAAAQIAKVMDQAFAALKEGTDPNRMRFLFELSGINNVPEEVFRDAGLRQQMARADEFRALFGNDFASFGRFLADAWKNDNPRGEPDYEGAFQRNQPTNQSQSSVRSQDTIMARVVWKTIYDAQIGQGASPEEAKVAADAAMPGVVSGAGAPAPGAAPGAPGGAQAPTPGVPLASVTPLGPPTPEQEALLAPRAPLASVQPLGPPTPEQEALLAPRASVTPPASPGVPGASAAGPSPSSIPPQQAIELPRDANGNVDPNDLIIGQTYNTSRGPAMWNGTVFIPVL